MAIAIQVQVVPSNLDEMIRTLLELRDNIASLQASDLPEARELAASSSDKIALLLEMMEDALDMEESRASLGDAQINGVVSWDEVKQRLGL